MIKRRKTSIVVDSLAAKLLKLWVAMTDGDDAHTLGACIGNQLTDLVTEQGESLGDAFTVACRAIEHHRLDVEYGLASAPSENEDDWMDKIQGLDCDKETYIFHVRLPVYILDSLRVASTLLHRKMGEITSECIKRHITHLVSDETEWKFYIEGVKRMKLAPEASKEGDHTSKGSKED